jgi:hypothetical protein
VTVGKSPISELIFLICERKVPLSALELLCFYFKAS